MEIRFITEQRYGGSDGQALNRHHQRIYAVGAQLFYLDRCLSGRPAHFNLCYFKPGACSPTTIPVTGQEYWGGGMSWEQAELAAIQAIQAHLKHQ